MERFAMPSALPTLLLGWLRSSDRRVIPTYYVPRHVASFFVIVVAVVVFLSVVIVVADVIVTGLI
jgi:hypothetical protein